MVLHIETKTVTKVKFEFTETELRALASDLKEVPPQNRSPTGEYIVDYVAHVL